MQAIPRHPGQAPLREHRSLGGSIEIVPWQAIVSGEVEIG
jgi:hypothetical protein